VTDSPSGLTETVGVACAHPEFQRVTVTWRFTQGSPETLEYTIRWRWKGEDYDASLSFPVPDRPRCRICLAREARKEVKIYLMRNLKAQYYGDDHAEDWARLRQSTGCLLEGWNVCVCASEVPNG